MEELKKYFSNLLILQYKNKPKAKATVEALVETSFSDTTGKIFPIEAQNAYNLDTATGIFLDVIGKYLGKDRLLSFVIDNSFKFADYDSLDEPLGYGEYTEDLETYPYLEYRYSNYEYATIADENYRKILQMLAWLRNKTLSLANIDEVLYNIFNEDIYVVEGDKELEYHISENFFPRLDNQTKLNMVFNKYFPRPMGCTITVVRDEE